MKILLASSEVYPFSKSGGLADMAAALAKALDHCGNRVGVVTPLYSGIIEKFPGIKRMDYSLEVPMGAGKMQAEVWTLDLGPMHTVYFIHRPEFYFRPALYQEKGVDYPDNAERFIFFSKCVVHLARYLDWQPEIIHVHDWQGGLAPVLMRHQQAVSPWGRPVHSCLTIHNLAYQGNFPRHLFDLTNLPWDYFIPDGVEFFGGMNCLKAGIVYADLITTVSPRYAREIMTPEFGCGLDGVLRSRQKSLSGILNGVDYEEWKTVGNRHLKHDYDVSDLSGKTANKLALQRELGLPARADVPLFGNIGRMVDQKGIDICLGALEEMLAADIQFVQLGAGDPYFEKAVVELASRFAEKASVRIGYDHGLAHRIEAACDFFLMPSKFEPCGLNQMYSLRYGAIPIVRATGGLDDSVTDIRENADEANGIKFHEYSARALAKAMRKAVVLHQEKELLSIYRRNAMGRDFSWTQSSKRYIELYRRMSHKLL